MEELKRQYDEKSAQKEELRKKAEITELKLERAGKLVSGLAGERDRWEASVKVREKEHWSPFKNLWFHVGIPVLYANHSEDPLTLSIHTSNFEFRENFVDKTIKQ